MRLSRFSGRILEGCKPVAPGGSSECLRFLKGSTPFIQQGPCLRQSVNKILWHLLAAVQERIDLHP